MYEFQYSALDRPWFLRNELAELLQLLCGGAQAETPSRWGVTKEGGTQGLLLGSTQVPLRK